MVSKRAVSLRLDIVDTSVVKAVGVGTPVSAEMEAVAAVEEEEQAELSATLDPQPTLEQ